MSHHRATSTGLILAAMLSSWADGAQDQNGPDEGHFEAPSVTSLPQDLRIYGQGKGGQWVLGQDFKARANEQGFAFFPALANEAERHYPVEFQLRQVTVGTEVLPLEGKAQLAREGHRFILDRGPVQVTYDIEPESVEQSFVFGQVAGTSSDLVLDVDVKTDLGLRMDGEGLVFNGLFGGVRYGAAIVIDGRGRRASVTVDVSESGLRLTVPGTFLAGAVDPVIVDPILTTYGISSSPRDIGDSDVAYDQITDTFTYVFETNLVGFETDIVYWTGRPDGTFVGAGPVNLDTEDWTEPRAAGMNGEDSILICALRTVLPDKDVRCKLLSPATNSITSDQLIHTTGNNSSICFDVGGNSSSLPGGEFLVPCGISFFSPTGGGGGEVVLYTVNQGLSVTSGTLLESGNDVAFDKIAISKSGGDSSNVNTWSVAYQASFNNVQRTIRGAQVSATGAVLAPSAELFSLPPPQSVRSLDVSDALDLGGAGPTYLVAIDRAFGSATNEDVELLVCSQNTRLNRIDLTQREHAGKVRTQRQPRLGTTASDFLVIYQELEGATWTTYLTALDLLLGVELSISERRTRLSSGAPVASRGIASIASRFSGGAVVSRYSSIVAPSIDLATGMEMPLGITHFANNDFASGLQFCEGTENSTGDRGFLTMYGQRDAFSPKSIVASALPPNSFGYMNSATMIGNVPGAGGSAGVLCIGGVIGRFTNQVLSSGQAGVISTFLNPQSFPSGPSNVAAIAGQAWAFQLWHRDLVGGVQTSNFTNGAIWLVD